MRRGKWLRGKTPALACLLSAACYEPSLAIDAVMGSRHPACARSLPEDPSDEPRLSNDYNVLEVCSDEDPSEDFSCGAEFRCPAGVSCAQINEDSKGSGYCLRTDDSPDSVALTYQKGNCFERVSRNLKAALCCGKGVEVDCREFPLSQTDARSRPGELCTKLAECEPGLLCAAIDAKGSAARCVCPGIDGTRLVNDPMCGS